MQVVNFTEACNNLKSLFDDVYHNNEEVIISLNEYNAIKETEYLLQSKNNIEHLLASLKELRET